MPTATVAKLDQTFDELTARTDASAAAIAIWKPGLGYWSRTYGIAAEPDKPFWWASVGKLATATIILQLIDEGKLTEETPISDFFPNFQNASSATVGDLLRHTSGIFSFNADLKLREQTGYKTPAELIAVADGHRLDFCPGTNWNYSNTGYVMLARIAEQIEGEPFAQLIEKRIAAPLELTSFRLLQSDDPSRSIVSLVSGKPEQIGEIASVYGAGAIVANPGDMLAFLHGYLEQGLVSSEEKHKALAPLYPMFGTAMSYGAGIMVTDVPDEQSPTTWIGHSGGSPDAKGLVLYDLRRDTYLAIALNNQASAESIANAALKLLE